MVTTKQSIAESRRRVAEDSRLLRPAKRPHEPEEDVQSTIQDRQRSEHRSQASKKRSQRRKGDFFEEKMSSALDQTSLTLASPIPQRPATALNARAIASSNLQLSRFGQDDDTTEPRRFSTGTPWLSRHYNKETSTPQLSAKDWQRPSASPLSETEELRVGANGVERSNISHRIPFSLVPLFHSFGQFSRSDLDSLDKTVIPERLKDNIPRQKRVNTSTSTAKQAASGES